MDSITQWLQDWLDAVSMRMSACPMYRSALWSLIRLSGASLLHVSSFGGGTREE